MTQVLDSPSVSGQRPALPLIALTELHHTVLIQLNPGALRVNHLIQTQLYLPPLSHTHLTPHQSRGVWLIQAKLSGGSKITAHLETWKTNIWCTIQFSGFMNWNQLKQRHCFKYDVRRIAVFVQVGRLRGSDFRRAVEDSMTHHTLYWEKKEAKPFRDHTWRPFKCHKKEVFTKIVRHSEFPFNSWIWIETNPDAEL